MLDCAGKTAQYILVFFNIIFSITGAIVLGLGIWLRADPSAVQVQTLVELNTDTQYLTIAAYIFIGFGAVVLLVGVFGCCGGIIKSRILLGIYIALLSFICIGEIVAAIFAAVFRAEVMDTIKRDLQNGLKEHYKPGRTKYTQPWDYAQVWLECCGVNNFTDYRGVFPSGGTEHVPRSCCVLNNDDPDDPQPKDEAKCQQEAGSGVAGQYLQPGILGIVLACCVCRKVDSK